MHCLSRIMPRIDQNQAFAYIKVRSSVLCISTEQLRILLLAICFPLALVLSEI